MPEITEIEELRSKISNCISQPSGMLRLLDQVEIVEIVKRHYKQTGVKLSKDLKERLAEKYYFSEKTIERLIYESRAEFEDL